MARFQPASAARNSGTAIVRAFFRSLLKPGDLVRGGDFNVAYMVTANYGDHITAVRTVEITRPDDWDLIQKNAARPSQP
jgi:hypothetical protein